MAKKDLMDAIVPYPKVNLSSHTHIYNDNKVIACLIDAMRPENIETNEFTALIRTTTKLLALDVFGNARTEEIKIKTPICKTLGSRISRKSVCLIPILRAGLAMEEGLVEVVPYAAHGKCGLARDEETLKPSMYLWEMPKGIEDMDAYILDPMLATGGTASCCIARLRAIGCKGKISVMSIVGAPRGVDTVQLHHPDVELFIGHLDEGLNRHGYVVPGLGDAGDRLYGPKEPPLLI